MKRARGWTGLGRGRAIWDTPELRAAALAARRRTPEERLSKFRVVNGPDECWGWTGCDNGVGYGYLRIDKKLRLATHIALEVDGRPRPGPEMYACHRCDNPPCTNPAHLFWGTHADNMADARSKGRVLTPTERKASAR